jgi:hypothetical protein
MTRIVTIGKALEMLAEKLNHFGSGIPRLRYCEVESSYPLTPDLLGGMLQGFGGMPLHASQHPLPNNRVQYSCYYGDVDQQGTFEAIAGPAVGLVNSVQSALGAATLFESWFGFVRCGHDKFPDDHLTAIDRRPHEVWRINANEPYVVSLSEVGDPEWLNDYESEYGPPDARCEVYELRFDPFTALGAVIGHFLTDIRKLEKDGSPIGAAALEAPVGDDVDVSAIVNEKTDSTNPKPNGCVNDTDSASAANGSLLEAEHDGREVGLRGGNRAQRPRPYWVNDVSLIGPISAQDFAKLMKRTSRTVARKIESEDVWRQSIASDKRYYFQHRNPVMNKQLLEAFTLRPSGKKP